MNAEADEDSVSEEHLPDARTARAAQRTATRIAESASGLALLLTALSVAIAFILIYALGHQLSPYYVHAWMVTLFSIGILYWALFFWIKRRRAKAGLPVVEPRRPSPLKTALLTVALAMYILAGCLVIILFRAGESYRLILIIPFGVVYGILWALHGLRVHQWEDVIQGIALAAISGIVALDARFPPEIWLILFALCFIPSGLVKHLRWRRWLRSLSNGGAEPTAEGAHK